ncbi:Imidazolonepropionase [Devosia sp. YR412]|uniref:metal-dependent hydrolase family protein n=1 Tax=Devosia sp. YR412 TaxID=1881030 RepID=UPI0008B3041B|nr:amidohydrolase family protein [Devosia sp. YR412]SEQ40860.1 Imidazolonepropionase [Devosia sp. YR412]
MKQLFLADKVIDGSGSPSVEQGAVLVEKGKVIATGRQADIGRPDGTNVIALASGSTLMPGLIDSHVHLAHGGSGDPKVLRAEKMDVSYPAMALRAAAHAQASLVHGFTGLRDMHAPGGIAIDLRDAIDRGDLVGPRLSACGRGLTVTGGHMDPPGYADHVSFDNFAHACDGPDEFLKGVRIEARRGADFIKLNTAVGSRKVKGVYWRPEMNPAEIRAACDEAHAQGLYVASHTSGGPPLTATVANGVDCVEHAHWIDDECIDLMAERGTYLVPTLLVNERNFEVELPPGKTLSDWAHASREAKWVSLEKARKAGIKVGSGTDAGFMVPHGSMNWRELALLVQGGYTEMEAIVCATRVNAELMTLNAGLLAEGRVADMLVVAGDPLADISVLGDVSRLTVYKDGFKVAEAGELISSFPGEVAA